MAVVIDSSVLIALERQPKAPLPAVADEPSAIAAVTASELLHGVHRAESARRRERRERFVEAVLDAVRVLPFDLNVARLHARLWSDLSREGQLIGAHDLQIAATALFHGMPLLTANVREFRRVGGLDVLTWAEDGVSDR
jgi:tRNA(fMet)-specific endonuclease VapC